jgi:signal transduction histidine kinase
VEILTDRQKLDRVVTNLVDNAIKFTERGGVTIELSAVDDLVTIRVSDTGIGVAEENVPHLFREFYQVNGHDRGPGQGFGMGLAICRFLARQLGGDVRLAHTGPEGSCFEVTIKGIDPTADADAAGASAEGDERTAVVGHP